MAYCAVAEKIHTHPMEGHWKFLGEGGLKTQNFRSKMKLNWNFPGGGWGGTKQKTFRGGEYGYFLELHILRVVCAVLKQFKTRCK